MAANAKARAFIIEALAPLVPRDVGDEGDFAIPMGAAVIFVAGSCGADGLADLTLVAPFGWWCPTSPEVSQFVKENPDVESCELFALPANPGLSQLALRRSIEVASPQTDDLLVAVRRIAVAVHSLDETLKKRFQGRPVAEYRPAPAEPPQDASEIPEGLRPFVELVPREEPEVQRYLEAKKVASLLVTHEPQTPLIVAEPGQGRTHFAQCLAWFLDREPLVHHTRLAGWPVVRVIPEAVIADRNHRVLHEVLGHFRGRAVVYIDDLDVLCGMAVSARLWAENSETLRSALRDPASRIVLTIPTDFVDRFESDDGELFGELSRIDLTPMSDADVLTVAKARAAFLEKYHSSDISPEVVAASLAPRRQSDKRSHPGLAVSRLDRAAAAASIRDEDARVGDLGLAPTGQSYVTFDAERAVDALSAVVLGQDEALHRVTRRLSLTRAALDIRPERPDGVFLFAGPTGTGKTELALALAQEAYGTREALIRVDMSEFHDHESVTRLVGPGPGYIGHNEPESWLTTKILQRPQCVLLLDEIEKAHPAVWNTFLQAFDAGRLTDGRGRVADFRDVIIVMTTNIGAQHFAARNATGFADPGDTTVADEQKVRDELKLWMRPELLNRLDEVLVFRPLSPKTVRAIVRKQMTEILARVSDRGWTVTCTPEVEDVLCVKGYSKEYGARPLLRAIEEFVLGPIGRLAPGPVDIRVEDGEIIVRSAEPTAP